jgi:hypothetical protein
MAFFPYDEEKWQQELRISKEETSVPNTNPHLLAGSGICLERIRIPNLDTKLPITGNQHL